MHLITNGSPEFFIGGQKVPDVDAQEGAVFAVLIVVRLLNCIFFVEEVVERDLEGLVPHRVEGAHLAGRVPHRLQNRLA